MQRNRCKHCDLPITKKPNALWWVDDNGSEECPRNTTIDAHSPLDYSHLEQADADA